MSVRPVRAGAVVAALAAAVMGVGAGPVHAATDASDCSTGAVTTYVPPQGAGFPFGVVAVHDGAWFAHGGTVDRVRDGRIVEYPVPDAANADVGWLTRAPGRIWFAARGDGRLGTVDRAGHVEEFQIPDGINGTALPQAIVLRRGAVWFTDQANNRLGRLDPATGGFSFVPVIGRDPLGMILGRDGDLYVTEREIARVVRYDPGTGLFTQWTLRRHAFPNRLVADDHGNVWFTELHGELLGRIDATGHLRETAEPGGPVGITYSAGHLFLVLSAAGALAELTTTGHDLRTWPLPDATLVLQVSVDDGVAWVTDGFGDHVYRVVTGCRASP